MNWVARMLERDDFARRRGWEPAVGDIVRISVPDDHPQACTGPRRCVHGLTGRVVQINARGWPNTPYYVIGNRWGASFALWEIEADDAPPEGAEEEA
jgi:hypothetical protein